MKKSGIIFVFVMAICFEPSMAQTNELADTVRQDNTISVLTASAKLQNSENDIATMLVLIREKQNEIGKLKDSISVLHQQFEDSLKKMKMSDSEQLRLQKSRTDSLNNAIMQKDNDIAVLQSKLKDQKAIEESLGRIDSIVYKQCLLYPLEGRYDAQLISDAQHCLEKLGIAQKKEFQGQCAVYCELLSKYQEYNQELMNFLSTLQRSFSLKQWKINSSVANNAFVDLKKLSYYPFYEKRNVKPYKSIIYLDEVIDDFIDMLDDPEKLNQKDFEKLIGRLR